MKTTREYLADLLVRLDAPSIYGLSKMIGVNEATIRGWSKGHTFSDSHAIQVADLLGIDQGEVLAAAAAERSKDPQARQVWERIADQLSSAAASLALALIGLPFFMGSPGLLIMSSDGHRLRP